MMSRTGVAGDVLPLRITFPKPGPLEVHLKDDHLQYAITWFALAAAVAIAFAVWLRAQRRAAAFRQQDV